MTESSATRMEVLLSMSERDRLDALGDELYYGTFQAEKTPDRWRRIDPIEDRESKKQTIETPPSVRFLTD